LIVHKIGLTYKYVFVKKLYALNAEPLVFEPAGVQSCARFYTGDRSLSRKRRHRGSWRDADPEAYQEDLARRFIEVPLFRRQYCKMLCEEIDNMRRVIGFEPNAGEDELRQIPEIVLKEHVPELYRNMWHVVQNVLVANHLLAIPARSERDRQRADCQLQPARQAAGRLASR
jgi:hypothetical protein